MIIKKLLSIVAAATMAVTSLTGAMYASSTELDYFSFSYASGGYYLASLNGSKDFSSITSLDFPDKYNDDSHGEADVKLNSASLSNNNSITSVKTSSSSASLGATAFRGLNALQEVRYTNKNDLEFSALTFSQCSTTLKNIYIYASSVSFTVARTSKMAFMTFKDIPDAKIHVVKDSGVKQQIVDGTKGGTAPVPESMIIEDLTDDRKTSSIEINCADINYGTKGGFKPSVTVKLDNVENADLKNKVTLAMYNNSECTGRALEYNSDDLAVGHYWIKASLDGTDEYKGSTAVKEVQVKDPDLSLPSNRSSVLR